MQLLLSNLSTLLNHLKQHQAETQAVSESLHPVVAQLEWIKMPTSSLETYESWNLELPLLPDRSRLYHLKPIAIGTTYVEGLISYVCRLAEAHCVSPGILTQQEILPSLRRIYTIGSKEIYEVRGNGNSVSVSSFSKPVNNKNANEQGFWAWQYVEGLQPLTLWKNLQTLTIPRWVEKIAQVNRGIEVAHNLRAWCPECFRQWRSNGQVIYEPLLWSIVAVTVCPYHYLPLEFHCPHCQKTQRPITGKMQVGRCSQCSSWLDARLDKNLEAKHQIESDLEWHLWVAERVMEVLSIMPNTPAPKTKEMISFVLSDSTKAPGKISENCLTTKSIQWELLKSFVL